MCGEASYREKRLTLAERGKNDVLKINDDDDDELYISILPIQLNSCPGYDVKLIRCCPEYDVKLIWRQQRMIFCE